MRDQEKINIAGSLRTIYPEEALVNSTVEKMEQRFRKYETSKVVREEKTWLTEKDSILITYGDTFIESNEPGLQVLNKFLNSYVKDSVSAVHILPMFPYTSDDGFSIVDHKFINPELGTWDDVRKLSEHYELMFDAVINHVSKSSAWFQKFLLCEEPYQHYFIVADPNADYSSVTRPRATPLLTPFETKEGVKYVWTTFSEDQIDLNFKSPDVLIEVLDILLMYAKTGARFIRLDAVGFIWKELGSTCMHLNQTHEIIKLIRKILGIYAPNTLIITETNVPQKDNISYFGNGNDEANLIYQFPLPPLVMFSILKGNAQKLSEWAKSVKPISEYTTYLNFLSSHDGIGVQPAKGILTDQEIQFLVNETMRNGGTVSYKDNGDGTKSPYELNISYQDALASPEESDEIRLKRFLAAETILLSMQGVPGIYIHSLLGSRNDYYGRAASNIPRRINREKLILQKLQDELDTNTNRCKIFSEFIRRLQIRKEHTAFSPNAAQTVFLPDERIFAVLRKNALSGEAVYVLINVSSDTVAVSMEQFKGIDLLSGRPMSSKIVLNAYEAAWILGDSNYINYEKGRKND